MAGAITAMRNWAEMIKFSHSVFALPYAVLAAFMAARPQLPSLTQFVLIIICMIAARSAAMTFNRIVDAAIDARNPRTANRQIPRGVISRGSAWVFFVAACGAFAAGCAGFYFLASPPNAWPLLLSVPVLCLLCSYSLTKRFTRWSHIVLGFAIAFAPIGAWIAINPATLGAAALLLMIAVTFWIGGFDLIYACQDVDFDRQAGLHSVPARMGVSAALNMARFFHILTVAALLGAGVAGELSTIYFVGVGCVALLLLVENAIVSPTDLSRVNLAFFTVNGVVGLVLGVLGVLDVVLHLHGAS